MMPQDLHGAARDISVSSYDEQRSSNGVSMRERGEIYSLHRDAIFLSDLLLIYFPALDGPLEYQYDEIMVILLIIVYIAILCLRYWLNWLNRTYLRVNGQIVPPEFKGIIDPELLKKITNYTLENSRFGMIESVISNILLVFFLFGGMLGYYDRWVNSLPGSFIGQGIIFALLLFYIETVVDIPFSLYRNFRIENRYGFNTMTMRLWATDLVKSAAIATVLCCAVVFVALAIVQASPQWWWFWLWLFLLAFGIFMMYISPTVIEPLFFKFESVKAEGLEVRI
ncbi:MAG TPA: hypothetical protein VEH58_04260, partial [Dehalococcoidales bacterium]|nr:hypothetical protein [Dehalococcoidales bacterium]